MSNVSVFLNADDGEPRVNDLGEGRGSRFIAVYLGSITVYLPGYDEQCAAHARALAAALLSSADKLDASLVEEQVEHANG